MNVDRSTTATNRPPHNSGPKVAVIGAGISGLICARILSGQGYQVTVLEKSRGVGGRMSTRRADESLRFDHGAQYFTARDPSFREYLSAWLRDGAAARWKGRIVSLESGIIKEEKSDTDRFVGTPGMSAICQHLAKGIDIRLETEVAPPLRIDDQWRLTSGDEQLGTFNVVIVSAPSAQSFRLLEAAPQLASAARPVNMQPCWALMLALSQPSQLQYSGAFVNGSPISWIARNSAKPERAKQPETWVVHASTDWTAANLDLSPEQAQIDLLNEFWKVTGMKGQALKFSSAHRWRYALPPEPLAANCLFDDLQQIGACGDWCSGPRVEGAFLSGLAVAQRVMTSRFAT